MRYVLFASLLFAIACGDDDGLTVEGRVAIDADGTPTGFEFLEETRLVDLGRGEMPGTVMSGECSVVEDEAGATVFVSLQAPGSPPEGVGLHRFEVLLPSEGAGEVTAQLGTDDYVGTAGAGCDAALDYREDDELSVAVDCAISGPDGATASVVADLAFDDCAVR